MNGFCAPNIADPFTEADLSLIGEGRFTHAKLRDYHTREHIAQLARWGVRDTLTMLPDLYPGKKLDQHIKDCWRTILAVYPFCNIFLTGNEPNEDSSGWRGNPWVYQSHMRYILVRLFERAANMGIRIYFVLPPLSYSPKFFGGELDEWKKAFSTRPDQAGKIASLVEMHHYAGANCYWEYPKYMLDGSYGMSWQDVASWSGLRVIITEYGFSGFATGKVESAEAHAIMAEQYPMYLREVHSRGAAGAFVFHVGGTDGWAAFRIPLAAARALATAL